MAIPAFLRVKLKIYTQIVYNNYVGAAAGAMAGPRSDNLSRKTASTGVCETSQTEYISQSRDEDGEDENGGEKQGSEEKVEEAEEDEKVAEMAQLNVKMLFLHNEQVSQLISPKVVKQK